MLAEIKKNSFSPETKQDYQLASTIQQNLTSLSLKRENQTTPGNQANNSVPKICAIFSLNNESKVNFEKEKTKNDDDEENEIVQTGPGIFEEVAEGEDEESIEEFDPEDPALLEDEEEDEEEEEEEEEGGGEEEEEEGKGKEVEEESLSSRSPATVYKYDMAAKSYVRLERSEEGVSVKSGASQISEGEGENQREGMRQPNILKRKLIMPTIMTKNEGGEDELQSIVEERKVQKLDTNNLSNVNGPLEEDGIMYVTVKGSKPNEILLVKVSQRIIFRGKIKLKIASNCVN